MSRLRSVIAGAVSMALLLPMLPAQANPACSLSSVSTIDFGTTSPLNTSNTDVAPAFTITCNAPKGDFPGGPAGTPLTVDLCVSYNNGSAGASGGGNRQLANGGNNATFDLYPTSGYGPTHWGNRSGTPTGTVVHTSVVLAKPSGSGNSADVATNVTTYGRLFSGQSTVRPATYSSTMTLTVEGFDGTGGTNTTCAAGGAVGWTSGAVSQTATVIYQTECRVGTINTLDFGSSGFLTANVDTFTDVSVTCTNTTTYKVGLGTGLGSGATTSNRKMTRTAAPLSTISYALYRDSGRTQNWGNDTVGGTDTNNGTGAGSSGTTYRIYGRVPPQTTPEPGVYQDTVVLTVAF